MKSLNYPEVKALGQQPSRCNCGSLNFEKNGITIHVRKGWVETDGTANSELSTAMFWSTAVSVDNSIEVKLSEPSMREGGRLKCRSGLMRTFRDDLRVVDPGLFFKTVLNFA
jgi:hypothetical protein